MGNEPHVRCDQCGRIVVCDRFARGFPPAVAIRKLSRLCREDGHEAEPQYRVGVPGER